MHLAALALCLLAAAPAAAPTPEPTFERFLEATKLKNEEWALGAARRQAETWLEVVPRYVERLDALSAAADPFASRPLAVAAAGYREALARLEAAYARDRLGWEKRCAGAVEGLRLAYQAPEGSVGRRSLPEIHARAKGCAEDFSVLVRRIEAANRELLALYRSHPPEVARELLAVQPAKAKQPAP